MGDADHSLPDSIGILEVTGPDMDGETTTWYLKGELDLSSVAQLRDALFVTSGTSRLVLDVTDLRFIDSTGIRLLLIAADAPGCDEFVLRNPMESIRRVWEITGLDQHDLIRLEPAVA